jgi:hypothetical protein
LHDKLLMVSFDYVVIVIIIVVCDCDHNNTRELKALTYGLVSCKDSDFSLSKVVIMLKICN